MRRNVANRTILSEIRRAMNTRFTLMMFVALATVASNPRPMAAAEPLVPAVSLQIHSARVTQASADLSKRFPGRYYGDGNPGVSLTLLLTLKEGFMLPTGPYAVSIETFVDDTYQSLLSTGNGGAGNANGQNAVSEDGRACCSPWPPTGLPRRRPAACLCAGSVQVRLSSWRAQRRHQHVASHRVPGSDGGALPHRHPLALRPGCRHQGDRDDRSGRRRLAHPKGASARRQR